MRNLYKSVLLITTMFFVPIQSFAAKPKLTLLNPAGGQIGSKVLVSVGGSSKTTKIWCSQPEIKITPDKKAGKYLFDIPKLILPGHCWIRISNNEGASDLKPFQLGSISEINEVEPNNRISDAHNIAKMPVTINGILHSGGEVDTYAIALKKGQTLVASISARETIGSPMDPVLQLVSSKGFVIEQNDDYHGFDPQIVFTAPKDEVYYVRTFAFPSKPNSSITYTGSSNYQYRLLVTTGPFIDYPSPLNVNIQPSATTSIIGWNIPQSFKQFPVKLIPETEQALITDPTLANSYLLKAVKYPCLLEDNSKKQERQSIMIPSSVTGLIKKPGEKDVYQFLAMKNQTITFEVESRTFGHPLDSVIKVKDENGKTLIEGDDVGANKDSRISYKFNMTGVYTIEIADRFAHGGERYVYLLTSQELIPDYSIEVAGNEFLIPHDKPLEIPVTIKRVSFGKVLNVSCVGLPKFIEAKTVTSVNKGDAAKKVKLILINKGKDLWSGPFQIVASPANEAQYSKKASAPIVNIKKRTEHLWLTALKPVATPAPKKEAPKAKTKTK